MRLFNFSRVHVDKSMIDRKASVKHGKNYCQPLLSPSSRIKKKQKRGRDVFTQGKVLIYLFVYGFGKTNPLI